MDETFKWFRTQGGTKVGLLQLENNTRINNTSANSVSCIHNWNLFRNWESSGDILCGVFSFSWLREPNKIAKDIAKWYKVLYELSF